MKSINPYGAIEEEILAFWQKNNIFSKSIQSHPEENPYVFYDGPPFATGLPHYGHILSSVTKDLFPRYYTMKGRRVDRRWGWDCHGLPIETLAERELGVSGKKQIEQKGIDTFNKAACGLVLSYVVQWKKMIDRIGRWIEFDNSYKTMDSTYMESVWWALQKIWNKGLIYEGRKVLMYCPRCETPVSNAEISMDNSYRDRTEDSVIVKFKIKNPQKFQLPDNTYILAWTTTPWTLPGNVALAVGKKIKYALVERENNHYLLAKNTIVNIDKKLTVKKIFAGKDLTGIEYEPLYLIRKVSASPNKAWYVVAADFVDTAEGTGVVHTAVIHGEEDFELGKTFSLPQVPLLDSSGRYTKDAPEFLHGVYVDAANVKIIADLERKELLFQKMAHTHSYPFCWRCESPLIYNAVSAWFINIQNQKERIIKLNEKINWYPRHLKHGRFLNILKDAPDWNISRNRYWATPLPFFKCTRAECAHTVCIGSLAELKEKAKNYSDIYSSDQIKKVDLHRPLIDEVIIKCPQCGSDARRIPEVIDCWVESAAMPFAEWHYPFENEAIFKRRFPAQFVGEYIAQTRAWFYYMHTLAVILFDNVAFENVVSTGTILSEKGEKLSKSKKNYPDPWVIIDKYGADALRFYLMSSVVMQAENLFFNETEIKEVFSKIINTSYNIANYYKIYEGEITKRAKSNGAGVLDKWIISRLNNTIKDVTNELDDYNTVKSCRILKLFIEDLSTWWLRRSRDRFKINNSDSDKALETLGYCLSELSIVLAPFTPFLAEHIYQTVNKNSSVKSVHLEKWSKEDGKKILPELERNMKRARKIVEIGHSIRAKEGIRVRQPLAKISWNVDLGEHSEAITQIIIDELNILSFHSGAQQKINKTSDIKVVIDLKIDQKLRTMGDLREFIRAIQSQRKKAGLKPSDKIDLIIEKSALLKKFIDKHQEAIERETNLSGIVEGEAEGGFEVRLSFQKVKISLGEII